MHLRSPAFRDGEEIPRKYTHDGQDVSPPLVWDDVPSAAKSLALIVEDPEPPDPARPQVWIHWLVTDLPPDSTGLPEALCTPPIRGIVGVNDYEHSSWDGPAPPSGRHHYIFKLFALDRELGLPHPTKYDLERALARAIVLAEAKLIGTYQSSDAS